VVVFNGNNDGLHGTTKPRKKPIREAYSDTDILSSFHFTDLLIIFLVGISDMELEIAP
jgi:hypothetical protein